MPESLDSEHGAARLGAGEPRAYSTSPSSSPSPRHTTSSPALNDLIEPVGAEPRPTPLPPTRVTGLRSLISKLSRQNLQIHGASGSDAASLVPSSPSDTTMGSPQGCVLDLDPPEPSSSTEPSEPLGLGVSCDDDEGVDISSAFAEGDELFPGPDLISIAAPALPFRPSEANTARPGRHQDALRDRPSPRSRVEDLLAEMIAKSKQCSVRQLPLAPPIIELASSSDATAGTASVCSPGTCAPSTASIRKTPSTTPAAGADPNATQLPHGWDQPIEADPHTGGDEEWAKVLSSSGPIPRAAWMPGIRKRGPVSYTPSADLALRFPNRVLSRVRMRKRRKSTKPASGSAVHVPTIPAPTSIAT